MINVFAKINKYRTLRHKGRSFLSVKWKKNALCLCVSAFNLESFFLKFLVPLREVQDKQ